MIIVTARYSLRNGERENYLDEVKNKGILEAFRSESGNISYEFFPSIECADEILVLEKWSSTEALSAHIKSAHFLELMEIKANYGAGETQLDKFVIPDTCINK